MGSYIQRAIGSNEHIIGTTKLHLIVFVVPCFLILLGAFIFIMLSLFIPITIPFIIKIFPLVVGIVFFGIVWLIWYSTEYASTDKRVLIKKGIIARRVSEVYLNKIEGALVIQSVIGRIFNYGTLKIRGIGGNIEEYMFIKAPFAFQKTIAWK